MKQVTQTTDKAKTMTLNTRQRLLEGLLILLVAVAAYMLLAFITYHNTDPGWSSTGMGGFVANAGGRVGAWFSDVFLYVFGYIAYLFPLMLLLSALGVFKIHQHDQSMTVKHGILRTFGFLLTLSSACGLASIYLSQFALDLPLDAGGILGDSVSHNLVPIFNPIGTSLLLIALFLVGITLFTGLSWLFVVNTSWKGLWLLSNKLYKHWQEWRDRARDRKEALILHEVRAPIKPQVQKETFATEPKVEKKQALQIHTQSKKQVVKSSNTKTAVNGKLPSLDLLDEPQKTRQQEYSQASLEKLSREIEECLLHFDIEAHVVAVHPGPVITRFELELAPGVKAAKVSVLAKDLARSLSQSSVRVVEVIPGKSVIGLEVPNETRNVVNLKEILQSSHYIDSNSPITLALGKDISGYPVTVDLAKMPHLLVSGTTGAGKSVSLNAMILSILFKAQPEEVRFIMVDPKMLELSVYDGIPHLLTPVVTDMKQAANAFRWCIEEMERRYRLMAALGVRNINSFNLKVKQAIKDDKPIVDPLFAAEDGREPTFLEPLPIVVIVVDELADMMLVVGKKVEELIARIAQKARAAGLHMILATQRPSVDVITGLIKANIPTRIAFQVSSRIDSRTILDQQGAEQLLGYGDMLYLPPGTGTPIRVHGAFVSDNEMHRVVADWKKRGEPAYLEEVIQAYEDEGSEGGENGNGGDSVGEQDPLYDQAVNIVTESRRASISYVQRRLRIGYNRAANLLEAMERSGVVSAMESNGAREVLAPPPPPVE